MTPFIHNSEQKMQTAPPTTLSLAVKRVLDKHRIDVRRGKIYNLQGTKPIGSDTYEPRVSVRVNGKKYNARVSKIIGYVMFGAAALKNPVRHKNGDKYDNRGTNLKLTRTSRALVAGKDVLSCQ
jgi:hypothetical protein